LIVHTLTSNNDKEFALHELIAQALDATFYFGHPYASWERGLGYLQIRCLRTLNQAATWLGLVTSTSS